MSNARERNPESVLVTGGCGFLGSNIAGHYLGQGARVVVVDALFRAGGERNLDWLRAQGGAGNLVFHQFDLADERSVEAVFREHGPFDYICHLAGQVAMTTSLSDPRRDMLTNIVGTFNVLEAMRRFSPGALLAYSSTNKVYGDLDAMAVVEGPTRYSVPSHPHGFDEGLPLDFASPYGCSKGGADQYVRDWSRNYGLKTVVFRHSSIYGGRQFSTFDQGWVGWFATKALEQALQQGSSNPVTPFTIAGSGKQVRDVLHAEDLIRLYDAAYHRGDHVAGEIFNIGGGADNSLSLLELFHLLQDLLQLDQPLQFEATPRRKSDQDFFVADIRKARQFMDWSPTVDSRSGIERMLEWIRQSTVE